MNRANFFFHLGEENSGQPQQTSNDPESTPFLEQLATNDTPIIEPSSIDIRQANQGDQEAIQPHHSPGPSIISRFFATDSSGSNESCETYITWKWNQLTERVALDMYEITEFAKKESISEAIALAPNVQHYEYFQLQGNS